VVSIIARKCWKCAKNICWEQNRFERLIYSYEKGPKASSDNKRNSNKNNRRRIQLQIYVMQRIDSTRIEKYLRLVHEDSDEVKNETNGKEKKIG